MNTDDIIAKELGKLTNEVAGKAGGLLGVKLEGIDFAASWGAKLALQYLPTETQKQILEVGQSPESTLRASLNALEGLGQRVDEKNDASLFPCCSMVVHSGFLNMNPAIVHLEILEATPESCKLQISAAAKEGLIRQHTAEKALHKVVEKLRGALRLSD